MKAGFIVIALLIVSKIFAQKKDFHLMETTTLNDAYDEMNLNVKDGYSLRDKRTGQIVFNIDTSKTCYVEFFNNRYLLIKQPPKIDKFISVASTNFISIIDAAIIDLQNPEFVYYFEGNAETNASEVVSFSQKRKVFTLFAKDRKLVFKRYRVR